MSEKTDNSYIDSGMEDWVHLIVPPKSEQLHSMEAGPKKEHQSRLGSSFSSFKKIILLMFCMNTLQMG